MISIILYNSGEYLTIEEFYGNKRTERSNVPLIKHIHEGIGILINIGASIEALRAFCIHPIVQNNYDIDLSWSNVLPLAEEYRDKANLYLCRPETDHIDNIDTLSELLGDISYDCICMLYADKLQNQKDFIKYHKDTHPRSKQLDKYFKLWLEYLESNLNNRRYET